MMSNYLLELSLIHIALMLGYFLFLRNERHYAGMRFYLIAATLFSLTIPWLKLPKLFVDSKTPTYILPTEAIPLDAMPIAPSGEPSLWEDDLLLWVYTAISVFFLLRLLISVLHILYLARKSSHEKWDGISIHKARNMKGSFSFFNWIFVSEQMDKLDPEYALILGHEKAHVSMGHTYDILLLELFKVGFWWLPSAWYVTKEIRTIHEYQADAYALTFCNLDQYASILIRSTLKSNGLSLTSSFSNGLIQKRLLAIKRQATKISLWKLAALLTLCTLLFLVFACSEDPYLQTKEMESQGNPLSSHLQEEVFHVVEEQPQYEGGMEAFYKYVSKEIKYPKQARQMGVEGRVDVEFVVEKDGFLSNVKAIKGIGAGCEQEAVRVVQQASSFKPGTQRGRPVRVRMVMPVLFQLNKSKTHQDNSIGEVIVVETAESKNEKFHVDAHFANGAWSGRVYDEQGEGLPGVNIVVGGTARGTVSDGKGNFQEEAAEFDELYFSFVGYETVKVKGK